MTADSPRRSLRLLRGLGALIVLLAVVVGVPALLVAMMRFLHMTPHGIPSLEQLSTGLKRRDDGQLLGGVLVVGVWVCWALFTVSLVPEVAAVARKRQARELRGLGWVQRPAGALVAAVVIGLTLAPLGVGVATAEDANAAVSPPPPTSSTRLATAQGADTTPASATRQNVASPSTPTTAPTYEVQRRDTLWEIAERYLRDPLRYVEIVRLNPAAIDPDNEIVPGAVLILPGDATGLPHHEAAGVARDEQTEVIVKPGDTLSGIEQRLTGSGAHWQEGWDTNAGRAEPGGERFTDPDLIKPGWTLSIKTSTPGSAPAPPAAAPAPATSPPAGPRVSTPSPTPVPEKAAASAPAATSAPSAQEPRRDSPAAADEPSRSSDLLPMVAFAGGGGLLLAGVSLTALIGYRRRQFRRRHPGRTIGGSPPELIRAERAVLASGAVGITDVNWLDQALRSLVHSVADEPGGRLPDVIAVRMTDAELTLVLTGPSPTAPAPWRVEDSGSRWTIRRDDPVPYDGSKRAFYFAPFPTLTSVGYTATGEHWLLDLERVAALSLTGDAERCLNLARFLAAEMAHNTWSEMLQVTLVGFGEELVAANPDRLTYTDNLAGAIQVISGQLESVTAAMRTADVDVLSGRLHDIAGDQWAPHILLIAPHLSADPDGLDALLATMKRQHSRASVALVLADDPDRADSCRWQLRIDSQGTLSIPALGVELIAQQIPAEEAAQLAQMLALAAVSEDQPIPLARGDQPWDEYSDACGGLTVGSPPDDAASATGAAPDVPVLHLADSTPWVTNSVLPLSAQTYLERAATTAEDLRALAPVVDDETRAQVERSDPGLDADLAQWADPDCPRPRISVLGEVRVRAQGALPERSPQPVFHTEVIVYLVTRPAGVLSHVYAENMWPRDPDVVGKTKVRQSIVAARKWLGRDPETGEEFLPSGLHEAGPARYRINRALIDAELFRRLRTRGLARGVDGIDDLWRALDLVQGRPFSDIPMAREGSPGGYEWLADANFRMDHEYSAMIVDTAHTVATRHFGAGEPEQAAKAAQVALKGGSYEDAPLLDLVRACLTLDKEAEAEAYVRQIMSNHDAEVEEDLPPRTAEVLFRLRRRWTNRAS